MKKNGKREICLLLSLLLFCGAFLSSPGGLSVALGEEGTLKDGDFEYEVLEDGTASITAYTGSARKVEIPARVGNYRVTRISSAYQGVDGMTALIIPEGVEAVDSWAFAGASDLRAVQLPESLTELGSGAFRNCSALKEVVLPAGLKTITANPFSGCTSLEEIRFAEENESFAVFRNLLYEKSTRTVLGCSPAALKESLAVPEGTAVIGENAFDSCEFQEITLPDSLLRIESEAFENCLQLKRIVFGQGLRAIGVYAFFRCLRLEEVPLPEGLQELGSSAFQRCDSLKTLEIPNSLEKMGTNPFCLCGALQGFVISDDHPAFEFRERLLIDRKWQSVICHLPSPEDERLEIPESVTAIGANAFQKDPYLREIRFPSSLQTIQSYAFDNCGNLESAALQEGLIRIEACAFRNCTGLKTVVLPRSLKEIEWDAFTNCESIQTLDLPENVSFPYSSSAFEGCGSLTLTVHSDEHETYCRDHGYAYVRTEAEEAEPDPKQSSVSLTDVYGDEFLALPELYAFTKGSLNLLTEEQAIRQILLRGIPLVSVGSQTVNRGPCLVLEQEDGSRLILEESFVLEDQTRWVPEESLIRLCAALFGENYNYYLEEPASLEEEKTPEALLAETESLRGEKQDVTGANYRRLRAAYGTEENDWSIPGVNLFENRSRRLVKKDSITGWVSARGVRWGTGRPLSNWYTLEMIEDRSRWGVPTMNVPGGSSDDELAPEALLSILAGSLTGKERFSAYTLRDTEGFTPIYVETVDTGEIPAELAYERLSGEEGKPFRVRVTLLEKPKADSVSVRWNYQLENRDLFALQAESEEIILSDQVTVLETAPSPAATLGLAFPSYQCGAVFPVAHDRALPDYSITLLDTVVAGEPMRLRYAVNDQGYSVKEAKIILEADVDDYIKTVGEFSLTDLSGEVTFVPTPEMKWIQWHMILRFDSGLVYSDDSYWTESVGGSKNQPEVVRLHLDRDELRVGETATVTYEVTGIQDLSSMRFSTDYYTESSGYSWRRSNSSTWDLEPVTSGTVQITPEEPGFLRISLLFVSGEYDTSAGLSGIPVREPGQ